ncbi:hypothetical protein VOLCADRAFT_92146 [Volvox carteri f. nagariensis]|uniref:ABC-2 type transporter transmembrane domain-containing protein n=1 Tax=Volvox carteri f. nagariensis TaxID=3068 RepID=D8TYQ8_VOLCA|nr:uncharacterized protein VOLCADRAFT_92146 [Volvox carteri f. nagariensis]EFJ47435.1 hypothetical protein VOLCADRAFT_92146 [Volvox carteri f. nagariensis]|eukprot:XP_002951624.1 hypothetical protein VOLCADRAFT_92146 [Volvox carteri f. nagariensis]
MDLAAAGMLEEDAAAAQLGRDDLDATIRLRPSEDSLSHLELQLHVSLPRAYGTAAPPQAAGPGMSSLPLAEPPDRAAADVGRPCLHELCERAQAALDQWAAAEGAPDTREGVTEPEAEMEGSAAAAKLPAAGDGGCGACGNTAGLQVLLIRLDHMHNRALYGKIIGSWVRELRLTGRLIFQKNLILLLLEGDGDALREYLVRHRTESVDVDSRGRKCKERMMNVVVQQPVRPSMEVPGGRQWQRQRQRQGGGGGGGGVCLTTTTTDCGGSGGGGGEHVFSNYREVQLESLAEVGELLTRAGLGSWLRQAAGLPKVGWTDVFAQWIQSGGGASCTVTVSMASSRWRRSGDPGGSGGGSGGGGGAIGPSLDDSREKLSEWQLFTLQTSAVLRKNATLQRRAWAQNLCLLGLPLLFCVLLLVLQRLVNSQLGSSDEYRCGCKCLDCCDWVPAGEGVQGTCVRHIVYGMIRKGAEKDSAVGRNLSARVLPAGGDRGIGPRILRAAEAVSALTQILSDYDFLLGTATDAPYTNLLEPALIVGSRVLGATTGTGSSSVVRGGGGGGGHLLGGGGGGGAAASEPGFFTDPAQALPLYHLSRNCSALTSTDRLVLNQLSCALSRGLGLPQLRCATWQPVVQPSAAAIERELFCGWAGTNCVGGGGGGGGGGAVSFSNATAPGGVVGRRMLLQQHQQEQQQQQGHAPAPSPIMASPTPPSSSPSSASTESGVAGIKGTALGTARSNGSSPAATTAAKKIETVSERIVQYPSAVYDWRKSGPMGLDLTIWVNNSDVGASVAPRVQRWPAAINAASNAWMSAAAAARGQAQAWVIRLAGIKGFPTRGSPLRLDLASLMGPLFFMWVMQLLLPTFVHSLVSERESGAQLLMRQQGLRAAPAALASYCWFVALYGVYMSVFVGFGAAIGLNIFTKTGPGVQAVLYLVWGQTMISWAFWFAAFWGSAGAATLAATITVVLTGLVANMIVAQFVMSGPYWLATLLEAFPSFALFRGLWEMSQYAFLAAANGSPKGLTWSRLYDEGNGMTVAWALLAAVTVWCALWTWYWGKLNTLNTLTP